MARGRGNNKGSKPGVIRKAAAKADVPDVYREMLADAVNPVSAQPVEEGRAVKRRRVGGRIVTQGDQEPASYQSDHSIKTAGNSDLDELFEDVKPNPQYAVQTASEDSADSDMNWEEVQLKDHVQKEGSSEPDDAETTGLSLVLGDSSSHQEGVTPGRMKRKPMTAEDKKLRLEVHKLHLCCLFAHIYIRNHWCNDEKVHALTGRLLSKKMISYLNPDEGQSQFQRSRSFMDGLTQASEAFRGNFKVAARGMSKSRWADSPETLALLQPPEDIDLPMQVTDFRDAARKQSASRDVGAQLFCAMLRSAGVDTRLVCSLQALPFQPSPKVELRHVKNQANRSAEKKRIVSEVKEDPESEVVSDASISSRRPGSHGRRSVSPAFEPLIARKQRKPMRESKYPIYWVEAFNEAVQKWVPIDPLVTINIAKSSKFEPPAGDPTNGMSYVIAFEDDGSARDVTRRYVKAYNAKTRRERVEVTNGGDGWWRRVLKVYRRPHRMDRDQLENAELATKEAAEPMPRNVQDFKDHPYYALERHLKRHEVIHPKREVGKVGAGHSGGKSALEPIFRRRDVHLVRSADKWYRLGREIKSGEQPLKRVPARRNRQQSIDPDVVDALDDDNAGTALYAAHQTQTYSAPAVVNGRIPKNIYGNLDVYVASMVPPGGIQIPHPETAKAAKLLGIDYADAVTGFAFKGRHGTAIVNGAVVAIEYEEAVKEVIRAFEDERAKAEEDRRSLEALRMWKRLLAGLRIRQRIKGYHVEGEPLTAAKEEMEMVQDHREDEEEEGGGFFPDLAEERLPQPTVGRNFERPEVPTSEDDEGGAFSVEDSKEYVTVPRDLPPPPPPPRDRSINDLEDHSGGGFLTSDDDMDAEEALQEAKSGEDHHLEPASLTSNEYLSLPTVKSDSRSPMLKVDRSSENNNTDARMNADHSGVDNDTRRTMSAVSQEQASQTSNDLSLRGVHQLDDKPTLSKPNDPAQSPTFLTLSHEELEEARLLEQFYESRQDRSTPTPAELSPEHIATDQQAPGDRHTEAQASASPSLGGLVEGDGRAAADTTADADSSAAVVDEAESSESDRGSLLSHDPDDEDAEPEWLS